MSPTPGSLDDILLLLPPAARAEVGAALRASLHRAHAVHPSTWVSDEVYFDHVLRHATAAGGDLVQTIAALHAGDLYLALAGMAGVPEAIDVFETRHFANVGDFIARIDSSAAVADEVRQTLRHRLLVGDGDSPGRLAGYTGRGPIGGWLRVCAVREAQSFKRDAQRERPLPDDDLSSDQVDPELAILKDRYGDTVSSAFKDAMAKLEPDHRTMLRMHYVDGLTIEQVGGVFRVSRATAARMLLKARDSLVENVRGHLHDKLGVTDGEAESILALVRSRIDLSLRRHLA
jgi:RNA polymerase sigma-70 factor (ECF subfamily)